jgi:hypothetical protein
MAAYQFLSFPDQITALRWRKTRVLVPILRAGVTYFCRYNYPWHVGTTTHGRWVVVPARGRR